MIRLYTESEVNTTIYAEIDKNRIPGLPQVLFKGRIVVVETAESAQKAVECLKKERVIGIDTETRPSFRRGHVNKVALLQLATQKLCFLFRLNKMGLPDCLKELLEDRKQLKVGLSLRDDLHALHERMSHNDGLYLDLQDYAASFGIEDKSLQKIYANLFGKRISKTQRLSNWEAESLTRAQKQYAATDAWACVRIYNRFNDMKKRHNYVLIPHVNEEKLVSDIIKDLFSA